LNPERWQQISQIFNSAIALDNEARAAYVNEQCGGDDSLRAEVEKLIESHQQASADDFIGGCAADDGAALLIDEDEAEARRLKKGQQFGSYTILDRLGAGGMGQVYLAKDSRLERTVALKVISPDISADKRRMQRFRQEAKVASSLNQPNILTIFEFGEVAGLSFLATEHIDGVTLRKHLHKNRLKLAEILDIAIQIVAALDAAHEARIVHRDIKPENVMIRRRDHLVKVLDFGLAKITEKRSTAFTGQESDLEAATAFKTAPGQIMGTISYMSPEQAQAREVDERTDIWSTGVILYEMVAGVQPFGGPTTGHTLVQIIDNEPPPLTKVTDVQVPAELQRIIRKAMAKDADERYQSARDMLIDLRTLRMSLEHDPQAPYPTHHALHERKPIVTWVLAVAALLVVGGVAAWYLSSKKTVTSNTPPHAAITAPAVAEQKLTYWITVRKFREGKYQKPFTVAGEINFEVGDQIRLNVRTTKAGHLYLLNEGPRQESATTQFIVAFPSTTANEGSSSVTADQQVLVPETSWLAFDREQGVERLWLVFSEDPVSELESAGRFANPQSRGLVTDAAQNKLIQDFLSSHSTKPEAEKGDNETTLKTSGKLLVYPIRLEHH